MTKTLWIAVTADRDAFAKRILTLITHGHPSPRQSPRSPRKLGHPKPRSPNASTSHRCLQARRRRRDRRRPAGTYGLAISRPYARTGPPYRRPPTPDNGELRQPGPDLKAVLIGRGSDKPHYVDARQERLCGSSYRPTTALTPRHRTDARHRTAPGAGRTRESGAADPEGR